MIRFQVVIEELHRIFFAGEEIRGQVEVDLRESLPVQGKKFFKTFTNGLNH